MSRAGFRRSLGLAFCLASMLLSIDGLRAQEVVKEVLEFPGISKGAPVAVKAELFLPAHATGRLPAMVIHHGSGGVTDAREYAYAREFTKMGVASIIPDSFGARGIKSTVSDQSGVSTFEMVVDAFGALKAAAKHPRLDPERIGITGFSKGGSVALRSALSSFAERNAPGGPRFALHVAFYPSCDSHYYRANTTGAPIFALLGGKDTYVGTEPCLEFTAKMKAAGAKIETVVYPDAQHGWDGEGKPWAVSSGENYSKCVFVEAPDRSWTERASGVKVVGTDGRPIAGAYDQAYAKCRTSGVSGAPDFDAKQKSLALLKSAMREALKLN